jgi:hypothetical protein
VSPEQAAIVAATERQFAERFEQLGHSDPQDEAKAFIRQLLRAGWRPWPALVDGPPPRRVAPSEVARAHIAEAKEAAARKYGNRPELEDGAR